MEEFYTDEKNILILIALLKQNNIKKVIASPGATNRSFVASLQHDDYFEIYSSVDERSAAYIACGMAAESGEPVVLSCTGATASRNYFSGLTEAYYRKLPVLAVTSSQPFGRVGNYFPQVIDRSQQPKDVLNCSVQIPVVQSEEDFWAARVQMNKAIIALRSHGGGPAHIDIATTYSTSFGTKDLPVFKNIEYYEYGEVLPKISGKKVGIFVGAHTEWTSALTQAVDLFCKNYNGVVFCDQTSNYSGKYRIDSSLLSEQDYFDTDLRHVDLLIHIGEVSGIVGKIAPKEVWRVSEDGEVRDTFKKLSAVFNFSEINFFKEINSNVEESNGDTGFFAAWKQIDTETRRKISELPFSNIWVAQNTAAKIPENSVVHLGILNSLRSWNLALLPKSVRAYSNTGGFGIDGGVSSLIGASLCNPDKLYFGFFGDLAFFYDMNVLGNRHVGRNVRILIINNGKGAEFTNYNHLGSRLGEEVNEFVAADGHFGQKSRSLVKNYALDLGYRYFSADSKKDFEKVLKYFTDPETSDRPMIFEVFTDSQDESDALKRVNQTVMTRKSELKKSITEALGTDRVDKLKKMLSNNK